ncbi:MAG: sodium:calcium antiporter [Rhodospirillaceae bacterium]|nr:sodium:calcium antiporter [Rhodospirillaceae bacterium]|tara:strand:- start:119 stop:1087 length:969 start_codon:yes stop_codon:yes gene_type:complete
MTYFWIIAGFSLLLFGGESVVRGSVALAQRLGVSPLIVGLTIVGFGTSLPEMVVSVNAVLIGSPGLAVGNVVGSNIANILLILGLAAVIAPIAVHPRGVKRDLLGMSAVTLVYVGLGMSGKIVFWQSALMLIALMSYIGFTVWHDNKSNNEVAELQREEAAEMGAIPMRTISIASIIVVGLFAVVIGAEWLVSGATTLARDFGVPEEVIGLTVVAIGTSLPELATSIVAACRGHSDVCVGNVLGSNLFNLFGITGVTGLFAPLPFSDKIVSFDLWVLLAVTALIVPFMLTGMRIRRLEGSILLMLYVGFVASQFAGMSGMPN